MSMYYSKRVKRKLQQMCCRLYHFVLRDKNKGLAISMWT